MKRCRNRLCPLCRTRLMASSRPERSRECHLVRTLSMSRECAWAAVIVRQGCQRGALRACLSCMSMPWAVWCTCTPPGMPPRRPACPTAARHAAPPAARHAAPPPSMPPRRLACRPATLPPGMPPGMPPRHPACRPAARHARQHTTLKPSTPPMQTNSQLGRWRR
jgi:hypothetical protein